MGKDFTHHYPCTHSHTQAHVYTHMHVHAHTHTHTHITTCTCSLSLSLLPSFPQSVVNSLSENALMKGASGTTGSELSSPSLPACSAKDRALLLALALKWRKEIKTATLTPEELQESERQIWVEHIRAAMETSSVGAAYKGAHSTYAQYARVYHFHHSNHILIQLSF